MYVEFDKAQICGLSSSSYMINHNIYINGQKLNSQNKYNVDFNFKKGGNEVLIIGKSYGTYESIINFK